MSSPHSPDSNDTRLKPTIRGKPLYRRVSLWLVLLGIGVIAHLAYVGSHVDGHIYTVDELRAGPQVQIISWPDGRTGVQASQLMAPAENLVWDIVRDQERFSEFMPYVKSAVEKDRHDDHFQLQQVLELPYATYHNLLQMEEHETPTVRTLSWRQIEGPSTFNEGSWAVERHGEQCVLRYQLSASIAGVPQWLSNYLMMSRLRKIPAAIEKRAKELGASDTSDRT